MELRKWEKEIEIGDKLVVVRGISAGSVVLVNGMMSEVEFVDGTKLEENPSEFVRLFKVGVNKVESRELWKGAKVYLKDYYLSKDRRDGVEKALKELEGGGNSVYVVVSAWTARTLKDPRLIVPERERDRKATFEFQMWE